MIRSDGKQEIRNHSPHERDSVTANRGGCRIAPGQILGPVYDVVALVDQIRHIGLNDIQTR
jgi:hypothetical protein